MTLAKTAFITAGIYIAYLSGVLTLDNHVAAAMNTKLDAINQIADGSYQEAEEIKRTRVAKQMELESIQIVALVDTYEADEGEDLPEIEDLFLVSGGENLQYNTFDILVPSYPNIEDYNTDEPKEVVITAELPNGNTAEVELIVNEIQPVYTQSSSESYTSSASYTQPARLVYYSQFDKRWSEYWFGNSKFGPHGCGATTIAMVLTYYGYPHNPLEMGEELHNLGYFAANGYHGTRADAITLIAPSYGLTTANAYSADELLNGLLNGAVGDLTVYYNGIPHQTFAVSATNDGIVTLYDPAGGVYTKDVWSLWNSRVTDYEMFLVYR